MNRKNYKLPTMAEAMAAWADERDKAPSLGDRDATLPDHPATINPRRCANRLRAAEEEFLSAYLSYRYSQGIEPCPGHRSWLKAMVRAALGTDTSEWGSYEERFAALERQIGRQCAATHLDEAREVLMRAPDEEEP